MKYLKIILFSILILFILVAVSHAKLLYKMTDSYGRVSSVSYVGGSYDGSTQYVFCLAGDLYQTGFIGNGISVGGSDIYFVQREQGNYKYLAFAFRRGHYQEAEKGSILYTLYFKALKHYNNL